jgi:hypothetical protein
MSFDRMKLSIGSLSKIAAPLPKNVMTANSGAAKYVATNAAPVKSSAQTGVSPRPAKTAKDTKSTAQVVASGSQSSQGTRHDERVSRSNQQGVDRPVIGAPKLPTAPAKRKVAARAPDTSVAPNTQRAQTTDKKTRRVLVDKYGLQLSPAEAQLARKERELHTTSLTGVATKSDVTSPLYSVKTRRNSTGGVDVAWYVNVGLDRAKLSVGIGNFGSSGRKFSSPAGSFNIFDPKGTQTDTFSNNITEAAKKAWEAFGDAEKMVGALKSIPGFGAVEPAVDGPSITVGTYNSGDPLPTGVSWGLLEAS